MRSPFHTVRVTTSWHTSSMHPPFCRDCTSTRRPRAVPRCFTPDPRGVRRAVECADLHMVGKPFVERDRTALVRSLHSVRRPVLRPWPKIRHSHHNLLRELGVDPAAWLTGASPL